MTTPDQTDQGFNSSYVRARNDVVDLIPSEARVILDVGCSVGTLGRQIKERSPAATVIGIEYDPRMAEQARRYLDRVMVLNLNCMQEEIDVGVTKVDCIILADVLEHLIDPWGLLRDLRRLVAPSGTVVASIPNIRHLDSIYNLAVRGYWPYRDRGIHDRTHLRFFTLRNIHELFAESGFEILRVERNFRLREHEMRPIKGLARLITTRALRPFFTFQYLITARPTTERRPDEGDNQRP
jgi:2-polyprenyl-3-methyl-5-hydroxy-6-metoxy-1,4-benzoquinol methylase